MLPLVCNTLKAPQKERIETFVPTIRLETVRLFNWIKVKISIYIDVHLFLRIFDNLSICLILEKKR